MISPSRKKLAARFATWASILILTGLSVPAQTAMPTTASPASTHTSPSALPSASPESPLTASAAPKAPVTVLENTVIRVMTNEPINSKRTGNGTPVFFTVSEDVLVGDALVIPRGATVHGKVIKSKKSGVLTGSPELTLKLVSLDLGGRPYPLYTYQFKVTGTSKTAPTETKALRGAAVGAVAGAFVSGISTKGGVIQPADGTGRAVSMAAAAAVGAGVGTAVSAATPGPGIWIPSEAQFDFYLSSPIAVTPVSSKEAARLAEGLHPGGPSLYVRGETP
ncbi:MAG: hypothetical protein WBQ94_20935 [Terracidiphilus sp.]